VRVDEAGISALPHVGNNGYTANDFEADSAIAGSRLPLGRTRCEAQRKELVPIGRRGATAMLERPEGQSHPLSGPHPDPNDCVYAQCTWSHVQV
jgi:hypothetical protein